MKKKIIFWLGADYTHFCLAYALQKKYDCDMYGIVEVTNKPRKFFEKQGLVNFKKTMYLHDNIKKGYYHDLEYLARFEKKYKIDLGKLIQNERIFLYYKYFHEFSYDEMLSILEQECKFFEKVLEDIKPDMLFMKLSALHHQELFYQMCKNTGVFVQMLTFSPIGNHSMLMEDWSKMNYTGNSDVKNLNFQQLREYLDKFSLSKNLDKTQRKNQPSNNFLNLLKSTTYFVLKSDSENTRTHYTYYGRTKLKSILFHLNDILITKSRKSYLDKVSKKEIKKDEKFAYFPLHVDIERTLLLEAPYFLKQVEMIKWVAKSLPIDFKLYVKEHPSQAERAWRSSAEYKEIMDIPNVVLIHPNVSQKKLYEKCSLVVTIAGTSGFEAAFYEKPALCFTEQYYAELPSVEVIRDLKELPEIIRQSLTKKVMASDLDRFLSSIEKNFSKFDYLEFWKRYQEEFFYNGNLYDVELSETKMKRFLEKNITDLNYLADEHIRKIEQKFD